METPSRSVPLITPVVFRIARLTMEVKSSLSALFQEDTPIILLSSAKDFVQTQTLQPYTKIVVEQ